MGVGLPLAKYDFGQGIIWNGTNQYGIITNIAGATFPKTAFSFICWFRFVLPHKSPLGGFFTSRDTNSSTPYVRVQHSFVSSIQSSISFATTNPGYTLIIPGGVNTAIHQLGITYDGTTARYYFDGVLIDSAAKSVSDFPNNFYNVSEVGRDGLTSGWESRGVFGDMKLINLTITDAQIKENFNNAKGSNNLDILAASSLTCSFWYQFNGNGDDSSGNSRHLTLQNSPTYETFN